MNDHDRDHTEIVDLVDRHGDTLDQLEIPGQVADRLAGELLAKWRHDRPDPEEVFGKRLVILGDFPELS